MFPCVRYIFNFLCFVYIVFIPLYFHIFSVLNLHTFILCKLFLFSQYFKCSVFQIWLKFYLYRLFQLLACARIILFLTFFQILKHISNYIKSISFCILQLKFFSFSWNHSVHYHGFFQGHIFWPLLILNLSLRREILSLTPLWYSKYNFTLLLISLKTFWRSCWYLCVFEFAFLATFLRKIVSLHWFRDII